MKLQPLKIRNLTATYPVIQAGMGVRIGSAELAAAVVNAGGFGTISTVGLGDVNNTDITNYFAHCSEALAGLIRQAREASAGKKLLGINVMVALANYKEIVQTAVAEKVDFIISGAGLPLQLPEFVGDADIALIPVISSGRAFELVVKTWIRKYNRLPDAVIVEGPRCGGHLGFTMEQIEHPETCSLDKLLVEVKEVSLKYGMPDLPTLAAGEVACRADIENFLRMGYDGVQIGTYFITAKEAGIADASKQVFINATNDDITIIKSPVGLPVRVIKTKLVQKVLSGERTPFTCPYRCLRSCNPAQSLFCIARALMATWSGDVDNGLFMCGCNLDSVKKIYPIQEFFDTLKD